MTTATEPGGQ